MTSTHDVPTTVPTAANAPQGYELRAVDPAMLVDKSTNVRRPHGDRDRLALSIGALESSTRQVECANPRRIAQSESSASAPK